jgi:hypothetical protein
LTALLVFLVSALGDPVLDLPPSEPFEAPKYGLSTKIPKDWTIAVHEEEDRIFVAIIPQRDFERPGVAACELALAPESLDDYRTRIDKNAERNGRKSGKLASNKLLKDGRGERLETIWVSSRRWRLLARGERAPDQEPAALHVHLERRRFRVRRGAPRV